MYAALNTALACHSSINSASSRSSSSVIKILGVGFSIVGAGACLPSEAGLRGLRTVIN